jgi:hypothetical protein
LSLIRISPAYGRDAFERTCFGEAIGNPNSQRRAD